MAFDIPLRKPSNIFETMTNQKNMLNALEQGNLQNQISSVKARYAPYTTYADAASKLAYANMLPYQIQAQLMSNPMVWMSLKDNPEALKAFVANFKGSVPSANNIFGSINLPSPAQQNNPMSQGGMSGLLNGLLNKLTGNQAPASPVPVNNNGEFGAANRATDQEVDNISRGLNLDGTPRVRAQDNRPEGSALVPAASGDISGMLGKQIAPFYEQAHKPGVTFYDPESGRLISTPTNETITAQQSAINAAERVSPQLEKLADAAAPFLSAQGQAGLLYERAKNFLIPKSKKPGALPTQYATFHSLLQSAPEALVKSYGLRPTNETIERMQKVIEPLFGETKEQYKNRIANQLESIRQEQIGVSQQQLSKGFTVSERKQNTPANKIKVRNIETGQEGYIPANRLEAYQANGYEKV